MDKTLVLDRIEYGYQKNGVYVTVIRNACGAFKKGAIHVVTGRSEAGKNILLSLMAGLVRPCGGKVFFDGADIGGIDRESWRKRHVGLVLQAYKPVPYLTALENAGLQMEMNGMPAPQRNKTAAALLEMAGFSACRYRCKSSRLNASQRQTVMLARAVGAGTRLLLVEAEGWREDYELEYSLMKLLAQAANDGACVILTSDSRGIADMADEVWGMKDGVLLPLKVL